MAEAGEPPHDALSQAEERRRRRKDAFNAARARAAGHSRDQIREIYTAELRARGLRVPAESVIDAEVARITGNPLPAVLLAGRDLARVGKELHRFSKKLLTQAADTAAPDEEQPGRSRPADPD
jgi:hypothetical protein